MTIIEKLPARNQHKCDICGRVGFYGQEGFAWQRYSSILLDDLSLGEAPEGCSDECVAKLQRRIESGRIQLPKIGKGPNPRIGKRKGY